MVYVTGDLHGDIARFKGKEFRRLRRKDILIVLGDFGFLWQGDKLEQKIIKKLGRLRYQLLFIDGCHENFDLLKEYPTVDFAGGKAKKISGKLHYLQKGQLYRIDSLSLLCFGGGESEDRDPSLEGKTWWRAELPTDFEMEDCTKRLTQHANTVDYIITHDAPGKLLKFMQQEIEETSWFQNYLDGLLDSVSYKKWFFARYHRDIVLSSKAVGVYTKVVPLE